MAQTRQILWVDATHSQIDTRLATDNGDEARVEVVSSVKEAVSRLVNEHFDAVCFYSGAGSNEKEAAADSFVVRLLQSEHALNQMAEGVVLLDSAMRITWCNETVRDWATCEDPVGKPFYACWGEVEILGPEFSPFDMAMVTGKSITSTLRTANHRFWELHAVPLKDVATARAALAVTISDITREVLQQQKLEAIHQAGQKLTDLKPEEIRMMDTQARIELLKDNIRHYTEDLLDHDIIEVRLLDKPTKRLVPLLHVGILPEAAQRELYALPQGNGVTGYVAHTGCSYLCTDAQQDPLYLPALENAASSLTVPLLLHDEVIGTINVESTKPNAFNENDLQFLEIFARDVAHALNTLNLLQAQQAEAQAQSCEAIHSAIALPIDQILNDAINVMEEYIGKDPEAVKCMQRIVKNARDIRQVVRKIGQSLAPTQALPAGFSPQLYDKLRGCRVLVVDADNQVIDDAHQLLDKYGCIVESAHSGDEAVKMYRNSCIDAPYDVVISCIKLPDYSGYQLMLRLKQITEQVPFVLMTGFGWDPGHTIVKARNDGLPSKCLLYKPFKLTQLLSVIEFVIDQNNTHAV